MLTSCIALSASHSSSCLSLQDGVELAAELRDAVLSANVSWDKLPARKIGVALRAFESRRSTRCAPLVELAARIGKLATTRRWWLVRSSSASLPLMKLKDYRISETEVLKKTDTDQSKIVEGIVPRVCQALLELVLAC